MKPLKPRNKRERLLCEQIHQSQHESWSKIVASRDEKMAAMRQEIARLESDHHIKLINAAGQSMDAISKCLAAGLNY